MHAPAPARVFFDLDLVEEVEFVPGPEPEPPQPVAGVIFRVQLAWGVPAAVNADTSVRKFGYKPAERGQADQTITAVRLITGICSKDQAVVLNALEPGWEARFEPKSYGFRPGRGCHDAIEAIYQVSKRGGGASPRRPWVLDADLAAALDAWSHCSFADFAC